MLGQNKIMAFLATNDAVSARNFYQNILGLELIEEHQFAIVFDAGGTELRIQKADRFTPQSHTALGWSIPDIENSLETLSAKGVEFIRYEGMEQDEQGIWHTPSGVKIAWFKDPDGNLLSLTQSHTS